MATKTPSNKYQIGLGKPFLNRARWIFFVLLFFAFNVTVATIYVGANTGQLEEKVVTPLALFWEEFKASMEQTNEYEPIDIPKTTTTTTKTKTTIEVNTNTSGSANEVFQYVYPTATPWPTATPYVAPSTNTTIDVQQAPSDWIIEKQKENEEWFEQQKEESQAEFDAFKELSEKCFDEFSENKGEYVSDECKSM